ncbi:hypothetical protein NECAME_04392 [Necator americanus]|nr:hypothetical protein NECAME_04392 [Necator americanus]ETN73084.1 hypothetical protein NECAME_04392 [Necator americanus]
MEDTTQLLVKDLAHGYPLAVDYNKIPIDYPIPPPLPPQANGFHLISEVTNTLLGQ